MRIDTKGMTKLDFFKSLYDEAYAASEEIYEKMKQHREQYKGSRAIDPINGESAADATVVRNITYELVESQATSYIPTPAVSAKVWSDKHERCARAAEMMLKAKRNELPFEKLNDIDERYNPVYGGSVWLVEWDDSIRTHNTVGDVRVACLAPHRFVGQPGIFDVQDMEYCFVRFETTREDIERRYGVYVDITDDVESEDGTNDRTATLYVCYYKNADDKVCQYVWSGDMEILDVADYFSRKRTVCRKCGKRKELCECEGTTARDYVEESDEEEVLDRDVILSDGTVLPAMSQVVRDGQPVFETRQVDAVDEMGNVVTEMVGGLLLPKTVDVQVPVMTETVIPYYKPNRLPIVIRKNTSEEESLFGQSDCEFIRPQQQTINKVESRILEKLISGGVYPIVPDDASVELDNSIFKKIFRAKPKDAGLYNKLDLQAEITRDVTEAERMYDHAKRILGISDSFQGQHDASAQSGKAKQLQIQQAAGRLDSKRQMKNAAYAEMDQIIFQLYLAYADEPRPTVYRDALGRPQNLQFNRYDYVERDEAGNYYYNDEFLFATDASVDTDRARESLWQENRMNYQSGAFGDPSLPQTQLIFWLNMERMHYPYAHDTVEMLRMQIQQMQEEQAAEKRVLDAEGRAADLRREIDAREGYEAFLRDTHNGGITV